MQPSTPEQPRRTQPQWASTGANSGLRAGPPGLAHPAGRARGGPRAAPAARAVPPPDGAAARRARPRRGLGRDRAGGAGARAGRDRHRPGRPPRVPGPVRARRRARPALRRRRVRRGLLELGDRARGRARRPPRAGHGARPRGRALLRADPEPLVPRRAPRAAAAGALAAAARRPAAVEPRRLRRPLRRDPAARRRASCRSCSPTPTIVRERLGPLTKSLVAAGPATRLPASG